MKNILIGVAVIIIAAVGYFAFIKTPAETPNETADNGGSQAKINIDAVCQGALAYMTFPSAAEAEVFVQECKNGEHPEVIEQYKASLNLGDGAAI